MREPVEGPLQTTHHRKGRGPLGAGLRATPQRVAHASRIDRTRKHRTLLRSPARVRAGPDQSAVGGVCAGGATGSEDILRAEVVD